MPREIIGAEDLMFVGQELEDQGYDPYEVDAILGAALSRVPPSRMALSRPMSTRVVSSRPAASAASLAQRAATVAAAVRQVEGGALVKQSEPQKARLYVLGFESLNIAAGAIANVTQRPQVLFRPSRIVIPATIAPNFTVTQILIGKNPQFPAAGAVPAEAFSQTAFGVDMKMDTCQITMDFVISVQNISLAQADFRAACYGEAVE